MESIANHDILIPNAIKRLYWTNLSKSKQLGEGCFGTVYKGSLTVDSGETINVAIKQLKDESLEELVQEAAALHSLNGAGGVVPRLYGVTSQEPLALVMDLCPGYKLIDFFDHCSDADRLLAIQKTLQAIQTFHEAGYSHGDIHEENILVHKTSSDLKVYIIDVGFAEPLSGSLEERKRATDDDFKYIRNLERHLLRKMRTQGFPTQV